MDHELRLGVRDGTDDLQLQSAGGARQIAAPLRVASIGCRDEFNRLLRRPSRATPPSKHSDIRMLQAREDARSRAKRSRKPRSIDRRAAA